MARIELELTAIVYDNSEFECEEYKIVAFVSDWNDGEQVTQAAGKAVQDHMEHSKKLCIGGCAKIFVDKEKVADAIFQNPEAEEGLFDKAEKLFGLEGGDNPLSYESAKDPIEELSFILGYFGWGTRFCDLTEEQVQVLIFALQESKKITETVNVGNLEESYYKSTGSWPATSIPF